MAKIMKLVAEQEAELPKFRDLWRQIGARTGHDAECERLGREAVLDAHKEIGAKPPLIFWARSTLEAACMGDALERMLSPEKAKEAETTKLEDRLRRIWSQQWSWGQTSGYWVAWYRFAIDKVGVKVTEEEDRRLKIHERLAAAVYGVISLGGIEILIQHPSIAKFDDRHRHHCTDGPALAWADGYAVYVLNGIRLTPELGEKMAKRTITAKEIRDEANAEVRRVLVGVYNQGDTGRYLRDIGAAVVHEDRDALGLPRRLLRIEQPGDEPFIAVEVTNSTAEPDGSRKRYTFRCHPELRPLPIPGVRDKYGEPQAMNCQNAIASTYGYKGEDFSLEVQT